MNIDLSQMPTRTGWRKLFKYYQSGCRKNPSLNYSKFYRDLKAENQGQLPFHLRTLTAHFTGLIQSGKFSGPKTEQAVQAALPAGTNSNDIAEITAIAIPAKPARSRSQKPLKHASARSQSDSLTAAGLPGCLEAQIGNVCFRIADRAAAEIFCEIAARLTARGV